MNYFMKLFKSRDNPKNRLNRSSYNFFMGGSSSGNRVTERSAMQMTAVYTFRNIS